MRSRVFAVLLALLWPAATIVALTIEAPKARIKTVGAKTDDGWNLYSNGRLGDWVRCEKQGQYAVTVWAHGSPAKGIWPRMTLLVDGAAKGSVTVDSDDWHKYPFQVTLASGAHEIAVAFTNDALIAGEDRNLYLRRIEIRPPEGAPDASLADARELAMAAQKREDAVLAAARKEIDAHRKADAAVRVVDAAGKPVAGARVAVELVRHEFLFGCNIYRFDRYKTDQKNEAYKRRFRELFNYATTGFYWRSYEPVRGRPRYDYTDRVVAWCRKHDIRLKGHPLLWDHRAGRPAWAGDRQPPKEAQKQRVTEIVRRYAGKIEFWEVVNEPSHCRRVKIDEPYRWAREADAKAYLIVNDYYVMANGYPPFFSLLQKAIKDGVPFDGIGIQAHEPRTMRFPLERVRQVLDRYASLGKELHITEFTPASGGQAITGSHVQGKWDEAAQADYAVKFYTVCFAHAAVVAVTWWDLCDDGSWLRGGGMLRRDMAPKPVYTALKNLIHQTWHTRATGETDKNGRFRFRGFCGTYQVKAEAPAGSAAAELRVRRRGKNEAAVTLEK